MPIEKKHKFRGLDLRTNVLEREDGTASDTSNVLLDGSGNLIKRNELKKLNLPFGSNVETELPLGSEVLDIIEYPYGGRNHDEMELLLFVYCFFQDTSSSDPDVHINKLYRVVDLDTNPVTIEEIPMQSWASNSLFEDKPWGRANIFMVAVSSNITYTILNKSLYISGQSTPGQKIPSLSGNSTIPKIDNAPILKYDGEVYHSAGVPSLGLIDAPDSKTISPPERRMKLIPYYIDAKGIQHYKESNTVIGTKVTTLGNDFILAPCVINLDISSEEDHASYLCENTTTKGGALALGGVNPSFPMVGDPTPMEDMESAFPMDIVVLKITGVIEGGWYLFQGYQSPLICKMRVSKIIEHSSTQYKVTIDDFRTYLGGRWEDFYITPSFDGNLPGYFFQGVGSGSLLAIYFNVGGGSTYNYLSAKSIMGGVGYESCDSTSVGLMIGWADVGPSVEYGTDEVTWPQLFNISKIGETGTEDLYPSLSRKASGGGRITSLRLEDFYPESLVLVNIPPSKQVSSLSDRLIVHDGDFVHISSIDGMLMSPEVINPFSNISVGTNLDGDIQNIFPLSDMVLINRKYKSFAVSGNIITGNVSSREIYGDNFGSVSPTSIANMGNSPIFVTRSGIFMNEGQPKFVPIGLPVDYAITKDHYDIGIDLSKTRTFEDPVNRRVYFSFEGYKGSFVLVYDFLHSEWFKIDGLPKIVRIDTDSKMIGTDGEHLYVERDDYDEGVDAFYKSNYLTAGEPSLKKQWHKLILFLVGSPKTEIGFDSSEDWGKGESEADSSDTLIVDERFVVDMKSFAPSDSYSRTVEIESKGTNELLINGYQVTYDLAQDDPVDENDDGY